MLSCNKIVFIDIETTGFAYGDIPLEVAMVITDKDLNTLDQQEIIMCDEPEDLLSGRIGMWEGHMKNGLFEEIKSIYNRGDIISVKSAEERIVDTLISNDINIIDNPKPPLAGASVGYDRRVLAMYMPTVLKHLSYRNIDVSSIIELKNRWNPELVISEFEMHGTCKHRAMYDILRTIHCLIELRRVGFLGYNG